MSQTFKLTGGKAVIVILAVVGAGIFQFTTRQRTLETDAAAQIRTYVAASYARLNLPALQQASQSQSVRPEQLKDLMKGLDPEDIEIVSISARGRGDKIIARAEIRVGGEEPPDGRPVRYFRMRHSMATGWTVRGEAQPWSYYLAF